LKNKGQIKLRRHEPTHVGRVSETMKCKFYALNTKVWNETHIAWGPFQTSIF